MRPIEKGKNSKTFNQYQDAKGDLIVRLGNYCSYCERELPASLAVEHVQPKSLHPDLLLKWDNFLLACINCNSTKDDTDVQLENYLWPDKDNTFLAFVYSEGGRITVNDKLADRQKKCAQNILDLVGLQKRPRSDDLKKSDMRWMQRKEAWDKAVRSLKRLKEDDRKGFREQIAETTDSAGHWSIWMTVFKDDRDMLRRFIKTFRGTSEECFDKSGAPIPRKSGIV
ncbi:MAG: HNH endonuclease [Candidatus Aminicenantes bacterium]|nr:HNH endonuclease [Candidatus Aminicenantes bacterium]